MGEDDGKAAHARTPSSIRDIMKKTLTFFFGLLLFSTMTAFAEGSFPRKGQIGFALPAPILKLDSSASPVSVALFFGYSKNNSSYRAIDRYIWEIKANTRTFGVNFHRDISISKGIRIRPFAGFVHATAALRPSGFYGNYEDTKEYFTAFSLGFPLAFGF